MDYIKLTQDIKDSFLKGLEEKNIKDIIEGAKAASDSGTFEVIITTENVDRMGEVIKSDGWELDNYMKNPVVLWAHKHSDPIGIATSVERVNGQLIAKGKFAPKSASPLAQQIRELYDLGIIRATSVGFIEKEREGNLITKAELLEFSFVSVPANPMCLSTLAKSTLNINEMITKGFLTVKEEGADDKPADVVEDKDKPADVVAPVVDAPVEDKPADPVVAPADDAGKLDEDAVTGEEKSVVTKEVIAAVSGLKDAVLALESLLSVDKGLERKDTPAEIANETEEQKAFRLFNEGRKFMQLAATALGESLAEARKAIE